MPRDLRQWRTAGAVISASLAAPMASLPRRICAGTNAPADPSAARRHALPCRWRSDPVADVLSIAVRASIVIRARAAPGFIASTGMPGVTFELAEDTVGARPATTVTGTGARRRRDHTAVPFASPAAQRTKGEAVMFAPSRAPCSLAVRQRVAERIVANDSVDVSERRLDVETGRAHWSRCRAQRRLQLAIVASMSAPEGRRLAGRIGASGRLIDYGCQARARFPADWLGYYGAYWRERLQPQAVLRRAG